MMRCFLITFCTLLFVLTGNPVRAEDEINIAELQAAAEKGDAEAQYKLGNAYQMGDGGVNQNDLQAIHWITKSANQGYADAQFNLGMAHRGGYGVPLDLITAYMWLELAISNGSNKAFDLRRDISSQMNLDQINEAKYRARHWKPKAEEE